MGTRLNTPFEVLLACTRKTRHPITLGELDEIAGVIGEWVIRQAAAEADLYAQQAWSPAEARHGAEIAARIRALLHQPSIYQPSPDSEPRG